MPKLGEITRSSTVTDTANPSAPAPETLTPTPSTTPTPETPVVKEVENATMQAPIEAVPATDTTKWTVLNRVGMQPVVCGFCTEPGQTSGCKIAVYRLVNEDGTIEKGACPQCVTALEAKGQASYAVEGVVH